jgi:hypothetical protein
MAKFSGMSKVIDYQVSIPKKERRNLIIIGDMGIGKTQNVQQAAERNGYQYVYFNAAVQSPEDIAGFPYSDDVKNVTRWRKPEWIPDNPEAKMMVAIEELNRAPIEIQQCFFQALTENMIHTHKLPEDTLFVICINPANSIYHVADLDPAYYNRCITLTLEADVEEWSKYGYAQGWDNRVLQFIAMHQNLLQRPKVGEPSPTCRSWEAVARQVPNIPKDIFFEVVAGLVGKEAAVTFQKYCDTQYNRPISGKEILDSFPKFKEKLLKQRNDEMAATAADLLAVVGDGKGLKKPQIENLENFLIVVAPEYQISIIQKLPENVATKRSLPMSW